MLIGVTGAAPFVVMLLSIVLLLALFALLSLKYGVDSRDLAWTTHVWQEPKPWL